MQIDGEERGQGWRATKTVRNGEFSIQAIELTPSAGQGPDTLHTAGVYEVAGDRYRERVTQADDPRMVGQSYEFFCRREGSYWHSQGRMPYLRDPTRSYELTEVWRQVRP